MRSSIIGIDFAKKSYINYNTTVYKNFDVFVLLYVKDIITISDIILARKRDKLSIIFYKIFSYFFLMRMKLK